MQYLEDVWYCAALAKEVGAAPLPRTICERPVVLFRTESGRAAALEDRCAAAPLVIDRNLSLISLSHDRGAVQ